MAWLVAQDGYKTWTVLKMTPVELTLASLVLAGRLLGQKVGYPSNSNTSAESTQTTTPYSDTSPQNDRPQIRRTNTANSNKDTNIGIPEDVQEVQFDYQRWQTDFSSVLECVHDILDLYTDHLTSTIIGPKLGADAFIKVRIELNREAKALGIPSNNNQIHMPPLPSPRTPGANGHVYMLNGENGLVNNGNGNVAGAELRGGSQGVVLNERSITGTVRFMLSRDREQTERIALDRAERGIEA